MELKSELGFPHHRPRRRCASTTDAVLVAAVVLSVSLVFATASAVLEPPVSSRIFSNLVSVDCEIDADGHLLETHSAFRASSQSWALALTYTGPELKLFECTTLVPIKWTSIRQMSDSCLLVSGASLSACGLSDAVVLVDRFICAPQNSSWATVKHTFSVSNESPANPVSINVEYVDDWYVFPNSTTASSSATATTTVHHHHPDESSGSTVSTESDTRASASFSGADFAWSQSIKFQSQAVIPHWQWKSPAVILQSNELAAAIIPDVNGLTTASLFRFPLWLDLFNDGQSDPRMSIGAGHITQIFHSVYSRDPSVPFNITTTSGPLVLEASLMTAASAPPQSFFRDVARFHWSAFGHPALLLSPAQQRNYFSPALMLFDSWRPATWHILAQNYYFEFPCPQLYDEVGVSSSSSSSSSSSDEFSTAKFPSTLATTTAPSSIKAADQCDDAWIVGLDFPGYDFFSVQLAAADPSLCQVQCCAFNLERPPSSNQTCVSWSMTLAQTVDAGNCRRGQPCCWLKQVVPVASKPDTNVVSGVPGCPFAANAEWSAQQVRSLIPIPAPFISLPNATDYCRRQCCADNGALADSPNSSVDGGCDAWVARYAASDCTGTSAPCCALLTLPPTTTDGTGTPSHTVSHPKSFTARTLLRLVESGRGVDGLSSTRAADRRGRRVVRVNDGHRHTTDRRRKRGSAEESSFRATEFSDSEKCASIRSYRNIWANHNGTDNDGWFNGWFQNIHTAYGMFVYGNRTGDERIQLQAKYMLNLAIRTPQLADGRFPSIFWLDNDVGTTMKWVWDSGWAGLCAVQPPDTPPDHCKDFFHMFDATWTMYWMLRWIDLWPEKQYAILGFVRPAAEFLLQAQLASGVVPSWYSAIVDGGSGAATDPSPFFRDTNAETTGAALMWLELYSRTEDSRFLAAAERALAFTNAVIVPSRKWWDYETFLSCSRKPFDFYDRFTNQGPENNLGKIRGALAFLRAFEVTGKPEYLDQGTFVVDYTSLTQAVWNHPCLSIPTIGGFTTQNTDAEWNDARHAFAADMYLRYYKVTGRLEYLERGIASLRASFPVAPNENWAHSGGDPSHGGGDHPGSVSSFHWGQGSGLAMVEMYHDMLRDVYVNVALAQAVGVNGCSVDDLIVSEKAHTIQLLFFTLADWSASNPVFIFDGISESSQPYTVTVNGITQGPFDAISMRKGIPLRFH